jgi:hypothetical protein
MQSVGAAAARAIADFCYISHLGDKDHDGFVTGVAGFDEASNALGTAAKVGSWSTTPKQVLDSIKLEGNVTMFLTKDSQEILFRFALDWRQD